VSTEYGPSPAERARTVLACAAVPRIDIAGRVAEDVAVHATNADGALVLLAPTAGVLGERAACGPAVATLHATRLPPAALRALHRRAGLPDGRLRHP